MNRARMLEALSPIARAMVDGKYIDEAEAWLAERDGLDYEKACQRARNAERSLGSSWPDILPHGARGDLEDSLNTQPSQSLYGLDPLQILDAVEAVAEAIDAAKADKTRARAAAAEIREADTRQMAEALGLTQRRAQQIKKKQLENAIDSQQFVLFEGGEEE